MSFLPRLFSKFSGLLCSLPQFSHLFLSLGHPDFKIKECVNEEISKSAMKTNLTNNSKILDTGFEFKYSGRQFKTDPGKEQEVVIKLVKSVLSEVAQELSEEIKMNLFIEVESEKKM